MITNQDRTAIRRIFQKTKTDTDRIIEGKRSQGAPVLEQMPNIIAAQNTLRTCMEVVFNECLPYDEYFLAEMAVRLATYAISAAPIERHQVLAGAVVDGIPPALERRVREGVSIRSKWVTGGVEHSNIPTKGEIQ